MSWDRPVAWDVRKRVELGRGRVSTFVDETIATPSGEVITRQYLTHPGAVAVVCWDEERDTIAVVRQYRHPVRYELVEIPAGLLDMDGEDHVTAARRELAEEAELAAGRWNVLVDITTTPGACEESLRIYLARDPRNTSRQDEAVRMGSARGPGGGGAGGAVPVPDAGGGNPGPRNRQAVRPHRPAAPRRCALADQGRSLSERRRGRAGAVPGTRARGTGTASEHRGRLSP